MFLAIGSTPNSQIFSEKIDMDALGYILVDPYQQTSQKGVFAIGDIADPEFRQLVTAAGDGCKAALKIQHLMEEIGYDDDVYKDYQKKEPEVKEKEEKPEEPKPARKRTKRTKTEKTEDEPKAPKKTKRTKTKKSEASK